MGPVDGAYLNTPGVTLAWSTAPLSARAVEVQAATDAGFTALIASATPAGASYVLSGLSNDTTYYWRVEAAGSGVWSSTFSFFVSLTAPAFAAFTTFGSTGGALGEAQWNNQGTVPAQVSVRAAGGLAVSSAAAPFSGDGHDAPVGTTGYGIFYSSNAGQTWTVAASYAETAALADQTVNSLAVFNGALFAGTGPNGGVYSSSSSWTNTLTGGVNGSVNALAVYQGLLFAATSKNGAVFSTPDGVDWTALPALGAETQINSLTVFNGLLYAGTGPDGQVWAWNGSWWTKSLSGTGQAAVSSLGVFNGKLYAGTQPNAWIYASADGATWTRMLSGTGESSINALASYQGKIYAGTSPSGRLYASADGATWVLSLSGTGQTSVNALSVWDGGLFAATGSGAGALLYATMDGAHWATVPGPAYEGPESGFSLAAYQGNLYEGRGGSGGGPTVFEFTSDMPSLTGTDGTTAQQTLSGLFTLSASGNALTCGGSFNCAATNQVAFAASDLAGNTAAANYAVLVDAATPLSFETPSVPPNGGFLGVAGLLSWQGSTTAFSVGFSAGSTFEAQVAKNSPAFTAGNLALDISTPIAAPAGSIVAAGLLNATTYYWRVRAVGGVSGLDGAWSSTSSFVTDFTLPTIAGFESFNSTGGAVAETQINNLLSGVGAQITVQDAGSGLALSGLGTLGLWHLDDAAGSAFADAGGYGNGGVLYNAAWAPGRFGSALSFNGSNAYAEVTNTAFLPVGAAPRTMSGWIKTTQTARTCEFGYGGGSEDTAFDLCSGITGDGKIYVINWGGAPPDIQGHTYIADGNWHYAAVTYDGAKESLYVDGVLDTSVTETLNTGNVVTNPFTIGRQAYADGTQQNPVYDYFSGTVDEVRLLNFAETAEQIAAEYAAAAPAAGASLTVQFTTNAAAAWNVVASTAPGSGPYFSFSASSASTAAQTLAVHGLSLAESTTTAVCGGGFPCAATNQVRFGVADTAGNMRSADYAILADAAGTALALSTPSSPANGGFTNTTTPLLSWSGPQGVGAPLAFEVEAAKNDPAFGAANLAFDLTVPASSESVRAPSALATGATYYWRVRLENPVFGSSAAWSAAYTFQVELTGPSISAFKLFSSTGGLLAQGQTFTLPVSTAQVTVQDALSGLGAVLATEPQAIAGTVGLWHFDEGSGGAATDSSGSGNNGTLGAGITRVASRAGFGQALSFPGNADVTFTNVSNIPVGNSNYTLEAWINLPAENNGGSEGIFGWGSYGNTNQVNAFRTNDCGGGNVGLDNYWWGNDLTECGTTLSYNTWHHVAATYDGTNRTIYIDGVQVAQDQPTGHNVPSAGNLTLGKTCCSEYFEGSMDEMRILNVALSAQQIAADAVGAPYLIAPVVASYSTNAGATWSVVSSTVPGPNPYFTFSGSTTPSTAAQTVGLVNAPLTQSLNASVCAGAGPCAATDQLRFIATNEAGNVSSATYSATADLLAGPLGVSTPTAPAAGGFLGAAALAWNGPAAAYFPQVPAGSLYEIRISSAGPGFTSAVMNFSTPITTASAGGLLVGGYTLPALTNGATYYWQVASKSGLTSAVGPWTSTSSFVTAQQGPSISGFETFGPAGALTESQTNPLITGVTAQVTVQAPVSGLAAGAQELTAIAGTTGLWHFDESSGSFVYDASGNGNTGTLNSGVSFAPGFLGAGLQFNGTGGGHVTFAHPPMTVVNNWTLEAWVNPAALSQASSMMVMNGNTGGDGYGFGLGDGSGGTGSKLQGLFGDYAWIDSGYTFPAANVWYHVAMVCGNGVTRFYVNGVQTPNTFTGTPYAPSQLTFGVASYNGALDEVRMLNVAESAAQIAADYANQSRTLVQVSVNGGAAWTGLPGAPGAGPYYTLSGSTGSTAAQTLWVYGLNFNESLNNSICGGNSPCAATNQLRFAPLDLAGNVSSATYAIKVDAVPTNAAVSTQTAPAAGAYVGGAPVLAWTIPPAAAGLGAGSGFEVQVASGLPSASPLLDVPLPATASSYRAAGLTSGATYYWRVRLNNGFTGSNGPWSESLSFVTDFSSPALAGFMSLGPNGPLSETQWNSLQGGVTAQITVQAPLSGAQLTAGRPLTAIPGTAALWLLGESAFPTAYDVTGNNDLADINGTVSPAPGIDGGAAAFNGSSYLYDGNTAVGLPSGSSPFTVQAWIKLSNTNGGGILSYGYGNTSEIVRLGVTQNGAWGGNTPGNTGLEMAAWSNDHGVAYTFLPGTWYNVAFTYDGSNLGSFFVNGTLIGTASYGTLNIQPTASTLFLGYASFVGEFNGSINQVRVLNFAATGAQLAADYAAAFGSAQASYSVNAGASWTPVTSTTPGAGPYLSLAGASATSTQTFAVNGLPLALSTNAVVCGGVSPCAAIDQVSFSLANAAGNKAQAGPFAILWDPSGLAASSATPTFPTSVADRPQPVFRWMGMSTGTALGFPAGAEYRLELSSADPSAASQFVLNVTTPINVNLASATADGRYFDAVPLANLTTYYWRVRPEGAGGVEPGVWSATASFVTDFLASPVAVAGPFSAITSTSVTVSWSAGALAQGTTYLAQASPDGFNTITDSSLTFNTSAALGLTNTLLSNTTYSFRVRAQSGPSYSLFLVIGTTATLPAPPVFVSYEGGSGIVAVNWSANGNSMGTLYTAILSSQPFPSTNGASGNQTVSTTALSAQFSGLLVAAQYYVDVQASGPSGVSGFVEFGPANTAGGQWLSGESASVVLGEPDFTTIGSNGLTLPFMEAFDPSGALWVANSFGGNVAEFSPPLTTGETAASYFSNPGSIAPAAVAFDASGGLWLTDYNSDCVFGFPQNNFVSICMDEPLGITFDAFGDLWVADYGSNEVYEFTPPLTSNMTPTVVLGAPDFNNNDSYCDNAPSEDGRMLCAPTGIAFNKAGTLAVSDYADSRVLEFKAPFATGMTASVVLGQPDMTTYYDPTCSLGTTTPNAVCEPYQLAFDGSGDLWVADSQLNRVAEFAPPFGNNIGASAVLGQPDLTTSATNQPASAATFGGPVGIAFDRLGSAWVSDADNARVLGFGAAGGVSPPLTFPSVGQSSVTVSWQAAGNPPGTSYTVNLSTDGVDILASSTTLNLTATFQSSIMVNTRYVFQVSYLSNSNLVPLSQGRVVTLAVPVTSGTAVEQSGGVSAVWYSSANPAGTSFRLFASTVAASPVPLPGDESVIVTALSGTLPVLLPDSTYYVYVQALNIAGVPTARTFLGTVATPALGVSNDEPATIVLGQANFTSGGSGSGFGSGSGSGSGSGPNRGYLSGPQTSAFDKAGNLWVADSGNCRVLEFKPPYSGAGASAVVEIGTGYCDYYGYYDGNTLNDPYGLAFDPQGNLWILDDGYYGQSRIVEFSPPFTSEQNFNNEIAATYCNGGDLCYPSALAFDASGNVWVSQESANFDGGQVAEFLAGQVFNGNNAALFLGSPACDSGLNANGLCEPGPVAFDATGALWVGDYENNRVLEFRPPFSNQENASLVLGAADFTSTPLCGIDGQSPSAAMLCGPSGFAFDASGSLWISDAYLNRATKFTAPFSNGQAASQVLGQPDFINTEFNSDTYANNPTAADLDSPTGAALDPAGSLWITDGGNNRVLSYAAPTLPPGPAAPAITAVGVSSVSLRWSPAGNVPGTTYFVQAVPGGGQGVALSTFTRNSSLAFGGLTGDSYYTFSVGTLYNTPLALGATVTLLAPPSPAPYQAQTTTLVANWVSADAADTAYYAVLSTAPSPSTNGDAGNVVVSTVGLSATFSGLVPVTTYYVDVQAVGIFGSSSAYVHLGPVLTPPTNSGISGNGPAAQIVLGQPDFTSDGPNLDSTGMDYPEAEAFDAAGNHWVADYDNNRVLGFPPGAVSGSPASVVLGQSDFSSASSGNLNMSYPSGVTVDAQGDVWVADSNHSRVLEFKPPFTTGQPPALVLGQSAFNGSQPSLPPASQLSYPVDVRFDAAGNLWVADEDNDRVLEFQPPFANGQAAVVVLGQSSLAAFGGCDAGALSASLCSPYGLAFDPSGDLWVSDNENNRIVEFQPPFSNGMAALAAIGQPSTGAISSGTCWYSNGPTQSAFCYPGHIAFAQTGSLWVADGGNARALRFDAPLATGMNAAGVVGEPDFNSFSFCSLSATGLCNPQGVAVDPTGGLWIADSDYDRELGFPGPTLAPPLAVAQPLAAIYASSVTVQWGLPLEPAGTVFVAELSVDGFASVTASMTVTGSSWTFRLPPGLAPGSQLSFEVFALNGSYESPVLALGVLPVPLAGPTAKPFSAFAPDSLRANWASADVPGTFYQVWLSTQAAPDSNGLAANISTTTTALGFTFRGLSAATSYFASVQAFSAAGSSTPYVQLGAAMTTPAPSGPTLGFAAPASIVLGQPNFTTDQCNSDTDCGGPTMSDLAYPEAAAVDKNGNVWVADADNCRVLAFAAPASNSQAAAVVLGQPDFTTEACGHTGPAALFYPGAVAVDSQGDVWVSDTYNSRVMEFKPPFSNGQAAALVLGAPNFLSDGCTSPAPNTVCGPAGLAFDASGDLWVTDGDYGRVLEFKPPFADSMSASLAIGAPDLTTSNNCDLDPANPARGLCDPSAAAFDGAGNLWVSDTYDDRVLQFAPAFANNESASLVLGQPDFLTFGTGAGSLNAPNGLAVAPSGALWVADLSHNRVLQFFPPFSNGQSPEVALGQPDLTTTQCDSDTGCNGSTASDLDQPAGLAMDARGGLWVADVSNSRVLGFAIAPSTGTAPAAASGSAITALGAGSVSAQWAAGGNANGTQYLLEDSLNGFATVLSSVVTTNTSAALTFASAIAPNTQIFLRVFALSGAALSAPLSLGSTVTALAPPVAAAFSGVSANNLTANWTTSDSPLTQYNVVLSSGAAPDTNGFAGNLTATVRGTSAVFNGLAGGSAYFASVQALSLTGSTGAFVSLGSVTTPSSTVLAPAENDAPITLVAGQVDLTTTGDNYLDDPEASVFDATGNLWVADTENCRIIEYPAPYQAGAQTPSVALGVPNLNSTCTGLLGYPQGLSFDAHGNLWVADSGSKQIVEFAPPFTTGQTPAAVIASVDRNCAGTGFCEPTGITFDTAGHVWITDESLWSVLEYSTASLAAGQAPMFSLGTPNPTDCGDEPASALCEPKSASFDAAGDLWVADTGDSRILEFVPPFTSTAMFASVALGQTNLNADSRSIGAASLDYPEGLAFDASGNLWAADTDDGRILEFQTPFASGQNAALVLGQQDFTTYCDVEQQGSCYESPLIGLDYPAGVAVDPSGGVWVTDTDNSRVVGYAASFPAIAANAATPVTAVNASSATVQWGAGANTAGTSYIAYASVLGSGVFSASSSAAGLSASISGLIPNTTYTFGVEGEHGVYAGPTLTLGATVLTLAAPPTPVSISSVLGNSLVLSWNPNVDANGALYRAVVSAAPAPGSNGLSGNAVSTTTADSIIISGLLPGVTYYAAVQAINAAGIASAFTASISTVTTAPRTAPYLNGQPATVVLGQADFVNTQCSLDANGLCYPAGSAFDAAGDQWVADYSNGRVVEFTTPLSSGAAAAVVLGEPDFTSDYDALTQTGLSGPADAEVDSHGNVWVADSGNNRVVMYSAGSLANGTSATLVLGEPDFTTNNGCGTAAANSLCSPYALTFDAAGDLWVADSQYGRILEFTAPFSNAMNASVVIGAPNFTETNNCDNPSPENMCEPSGLGFDASGNLWVADEFGRALEFAGPSFINGQGAVLVLGEPDMYSTCSGAAQNETCGAQTLAFGAGGTLFVSDDAGNRVVGFLPPFSNGMNASLVVGQPDFTSSGIAIVTAASLNEPEGVSVDAGGQLWVSDSGNDRALGYVTNAQTLAQQAASLPPAVSPALTGAALGISSITWTWAAQAGVTGYDFHSPLGGSVITPAPTTYMVTGLSINTPYTASVGALNAFGEAVNSTSTLYTLAVAPAGLTLINAGISTAAFTWSQAANPNGTSYILDYWTVGGSTLTQPVMSATTGTLTNLSGGATYYVDVQAVNGNGVVTALTGSPVKLVTLPINDAVQTIGAGGGVITFSPGQGDIIVSIPAGAFTSSVTVTLDTPQTGTLPGPNSAAGSFANTDVAVQISFSQTVQLLQPMEISLSYSGSDLSAFNPADLVIAQYDPVHGVWVPLPSTVNISGQLVTAYALNFLGNTNSLASTDNFVKESLSKSGTGTAGLFQIMAVTAAKNLSAPKVFPNPFRPARGEAYITFSNLPANTTLKIYDILGEKVRELSADGSGIAIWDGKNSNGNGVASGVYFVLAGSGSSRTTLKVAIQR